MCSVEEVDTDKFVRQSTLGVIKECINTDTPDTGAAQPVGIGLSFFTLYVTVCTNSISITQDNKQQKTCIINLI